MKLLWNEEPMIRSTDNEERQLPEEMKRIAIDFLLPEDFMTKMPENMDKYVENQVRGSVYMKNRVEIGVGEDFLICGEIDTETGKSNHQIHKSLCYITDTLVRENRTPEPAISYEAPQRKYQDRARF